MESPQAHKAKVLAAYETLAESYNALIEHKPHNAFYDRPNTLSLLPEVAGKTILDAGCGPGKYAEILIGKGADVIGFDLSPRMIELAKARNKDQGQFFVHDLAAPLHMQADASVDIVLSALALAYIPDWNPTFKEFHRVLKPGGRLIISTDHPFSDYHLFNSKNYFALEPAKCVWKGFGFPVEINSYRRSLTDCIKAFSQNGFLIEQILEPRPTPEFEALDPRHFQELNAFPGFLCVRGMKGS